MLLEVLRFAQNDIPKNKKFQELCLRCIYLFQVNMIDPLPVLSNNFDQPNNVVVKLLQVFSGDPPLYVETTTNLVDGITAHKRFRLMCKLSAE
jgi:hypothetical protein